MGSDSYGETAFLCVIIISIHAPLVGSDGCGICLQRCQLDFNPRSPCGERHTALNQKAIALCISIHAPLVGSDFYYFHCSFLLTISIHAPLVGSDRELVEWFPPGPPDFNPRSPCGERPVQNLPCRRRMPISIHTPHAGSDGLLPLHA